MIFVTLQIIMSYASRANDCPHFSQGTTHGIRAKSTREWAQNLLEMELALTNDLQSSQHLQLHLVRQALHRQQSYPLSSRKPWLSNR